jgi:acetate kinase
MAMTDAIVVFNSGSTSLKFGTYAQGSRDRPEPLCHGAITAMQDDPRFAVTDAAKAPLGSHAWGKGHAIDHRTALHFVLSWIEANLKHVTIIGAGHRVVLGGARHQAPALITPGVLDELDALSAMEPSHQAFNVRGARAFSEAFPGLPQIACFDSSFHRTMPEVAQTYALPQEVRDAGVRHWGYHGISYDYISQQLPRFAPGARRVIVAHLGGGASMCAMLDGRSIDTTMGFGAISGLPMATRSGDVPAGALFYLLRAGLYDVKSLEAMLYEKSGLLGLSGISDDMRVLETSPDPRAAAAVAHFVYAITRYAGAYAAALGGLDAFVFTAGIGENAASLRAAVCERLAWLGLELDAGANAKGGPRISAPDSRVSAWVIPTNEELMIADHAWALIRAAEPPTDRCHRSAG